MASEKRLIDANALTYVYCDGCSAKAQGCRPFDDPVCGTVELINEAPTVDAVEVVHGEWVVCGDGEYVPFMCSACGKTTSWYHAQTANYCPNCGAKMNGDKNNE